MYSAKYTNHYLGVGHKIPLHLQIFKSNESCAISMFATRRLWHCHLFFQLFENGCQTQLDSTNMAI